MVDRSVAAPTAVALVRLGESRDAESWRLLVERHGPAMYRAAYAVMRDEHLAADACQESFLLVRDGARRFRPRGGDAEACAQGWLVRVATTTALMLLRGTRRRWRREHELRDAVVPPADEADEATRADRLRDEIADLPAIYREALLLHAYGDMRYPAIAGALGISEGTARMRVHRAISRLRARLASPAALAALTEPAAKTRSPLPALGIAWVGLLESPLAPTLPVAAVLGHSAAWTATVATGALAASIGIAITCGLVLAGSAAGRGPDRVGAAPPEGAQAPAAGWGTDLPANTWIAVTPSYAGAPDGGSLSPSCYCNQSAYDPVSRRVLVYDTWADPVRKPGSFANALLAFDPQANAVTLLKVGNWRSVERPGRTETIALPGNATDPTPVDRQPMGCFALATDRRTVFLANGLNQGANFHGLANAPITDTWAFDLAAGSWSLVSDETSMPPNPPYIGPEVMAYDPAAKVVALFVDSYQGTQTWLLDPAAGRAGRWRALPRDASADTVHAAGSGAAYDSKRGRIVLYATAGIDLAAPSPQLWAYSPTQNRWTRLADCPASAIAPGFAYSATHDVFLALAGEQTWIYDPAADAWSPLRASLDRGGSLRFQSIAYDPAHDVFVFQGGVWNRPIWSLFRYRRDLVP